MISINASNFEYKSSKKAYVAKIRGRADGRLVFDREFIGGQNDTCLIDQPGLYEARNIDRKGNTDDTYHIVAEWDGHLVRQEVDKPRAMALAKKMPGNVDWLKEWKKDHAPRLLDSITAGEAKPQDEELELKDQDLVVRMGLLPSGKHVRGPVVALRKTLYKNMTESPKVSAARIKQLEKVHELMVKFEVTIDELATFITGKENQP